MQRIRRLLESEQVRFLLVGGVNTVVGYLLFVVAYLFLGSRIGYLGALLASYVVAVAIAFVLHRRVTFRAHGSGSILLDFVRFVGVYAVSLSLNAVLLPLLVEAARVPPLLAQALSVVVTTTVSYVGHKWFSFRRAAPPVEEEPVGVSPPRAD